MTAFVGFPQDGHSFSADEVGRALAGLVRRESNGTPRVGMLAVGPALTAVAASWKVEVGVFTYVHQVSGAVQLSGLSAAEQVDIVPASGDIPGGQARIDLIVWDPAGAELAMVKGTPSASPSAPSAGGLAPVATVRVNAGDGMTVQGQIAAAYDLTALQSVEAPVARGTVSKRAVPAGGVVNVSVTFPVGLFDAAPNVQVSGWGDARDCTVNVDSITAAGCVVRLGSLAVVSRTIGAQWRAEQG